MKNREQKCAKTDFRAKAWPNAKGWKTAETLKVKQVTGHSMFFVGGGGNGGSGDIIVTFNCYRNRT
jgi:hypothetical protein